jgi:hypothetical protein
MHLHRTARKQIYRTRLTISTATLLKSVQLAVTIDITAAVHFYTCLLCFHCLLRSYSLHVPAAPQGF